MIRRIGGTHTLQNENGSRAEGKYSLDFSITYVPAHLMLLNREMFRRCTLESQSKQEIRIIQKLIEAEVQRRIQAIVSSLVSSSTPSLSYRSRKVAHKRPTQDQPS